MTNAGVLEKSADVMVALESPRARLSESHRSTVDESQTFIAEVQKVVSTMDGQLAAMRFLAQKQYRPKSDAVPPGQLALDLLGFMLAQKDSGQGESLCPVEPSEPVSPKAPPRDMRASKLHLVSVRKELPEAEARREFAYEPAKLYFKEEKLVKYACRCCSVGVTTVPATPKLIEGSQRVELHRGGRLPSDTGRARATPPSVARAVVLAEHARFLMRKARVSPGRARATPPSVARAPRIP